MSIERTLVLIKPDGVMKGEKVINAIKKRYRDAGLKIVYQAEIQFGWDEAYKFYEDHRGKFYWEGLILSMISANSLALILEGENVIEIVRKMNGSTDPREAAPGTIRHDFRSAGGPFNTVHASDSVESFHREIGVLGAPGISFHFFVSAQS